ncbi:GNAT family N-acetyltransferase [Sphingomonas radiodurans]|uniref:GNAT family N-acetyltransferase n=1 Tax=Sphingomonas radiodurans TaxID=2890321 RepID=UPI001E2B640A|nr:GNAT family N-acetyltransferase [Sphingomonas radiodurans]WBH15177.1 GNAT family N-acetyltransferase [Sphingomonas radiodurans]
MIELSDDRNRIDVATVQGWLALSYWSPGIERELVERAIAGSHCLGAYDGEVQVGFARMITDHATFAWLADVWIEERMRGQGIARRMVQWFLDHPGFAGIRRIALTTADAHGVYAALGFTPLVRPGRYMERIAPDLRAILEAAP